MVDLPSMYGQNRLVPLNLSVQSANYVILYQSLVSEPKCPF